MYHLSIIKSEYVTPECVYEKMTQEGIICTSGDSFGCGINDWNEEGDVLTW